MLQALAVFVSDKLALPRLAIEPKSPEVWVQVMQGGLPCLLAIEDIAAEDWTLQLPNTSPGQ
jgi:hypothetical protein